MNIDNQNIPIIPTPSLNRTVPLSEEEIKHYDQVFSEADIILDAISLSEGRTWILKGEEKLKEIARSGVAQPLKLSAIDAEFYQAWVKARGSGGTPASAHPASTARPEHQDSAMKVKVYDFKSKTITEMPQEELAPGYVKTRIQGMDGEYFVNTADAKTASAYRHPVFDDEERKIMRYLEHVFHDVHPMTAQEWEDGFRKDTNMDKEILLWLQMAEIYQHFTASRKLSPEAKKDYLAIILTVFNSGLDVVHSLIDLQCLTRAELEEVIDYVRKTKPTAKYLEKYMGRGGEQ